ncbi:zinc finger SWIM domain-containing protein 3-like [Mercenaria mercenaria]|uniref:zinc finger SWIM domain-containing protein 3-like n=1 Tax=Mercenaria mercenaria TaxID=6596 RepID=UPI00234F61F4|nr:zinc finger SWIM domain-containing protein 3-like [Mercenaria mercenaria]
MASVSFQIGEKFPTFLSLQTKIEQYQSANNVQLYRRSSRSLSAAKSRCPNKVFNDDIKFWELSYSCIHGGKQFKARGSGARNQSLRSFYSFFQLFCLLCLNAIYCVFSTFRMGCKAEVRLHASADGQTLEVKYVNEIHNHDVNKTMFRNLFQQRRLCAEDKENITSMLDVKANKKMIQQKVMSESGKVITLKDIHNIKASSKSNVSDLTVLQRAVEHLSTNLGAFVKVISNDENEMRGLYFQDQRMRQTFESYPEFICVDATYKVNDLRMPLYILLVENGNGQSEVVGIWLVADETEDMITQMVSMFKEQNPAWSQVKTVMSDKDFVEREVFSKEFPDASLRVCLFHVLRTFRREVTSEKMGVNRAQRDSVLQILQKIAYSNSLSEYKDNKELLEGTNIQPAIAYFSQHWDSIKDQWVVGLSSSYSLGNKTNNRLESINQKIKQVVDKNAKFDSFAADMCTFLETHRTEIDGKVCQASSKVPVTYVGDETNVKTILRQNLTPYAFNILDKELNRYENVDLMPHAADSFKVNNTAIIATSESCSCTFNSQFILPCRHIFAVRAKLEQPIYDETLIPRRWTRKHYLHSLHITQTDNIMSTDRQQKTAKPTSQQQRYRAAFHISQRLASCAAEETGGVFDLRLQQLSTLLQAWERGKDVVIEASTDSATEIETNQPELILAETENDCNGTETALMTLLLKFNK